MRASGMKADVKAEGVGEPRLVPRGGEHRAERGLRTVGPQNEIPRMLASR